MLESWFFAVQLHTLSRATPAYSAFLAVITLACFLWSLQHGLTRARFLWVLANVAVFTYLFGLDTFVSGELPQAGNIVRLVTPFAIAIILAMSVRSMQQLHRISQIYLVVVLMGAFSMFYQVLFGPVSWFAEPSARAGVTRYASLLGSLTIFGTAAPFGLLCLARFVRPAVLFAAGTAFLVLAAMLSLQKAAVMGFLIALPFVFLLTSARAKATTAALLAMAIVLAVWLTPPDYARYLEAGVSYFFRPSYNTDDVSIIQSITDRVVALPAELVTTYGPQALLLGIGLRGGGGVFGFDDLPMAHNGIIDYLAIGGVVFLAYGLWICISMLKLVLSLPVLVAERILDRRDAIFLCGMAVLFLANLPFSSGLQFQPNISWIFAMLVAADLLLSETSAGTISTPR